MTESVNRKFAKLGLGVSDTGTLTVNAATASKWATARSITLGGDLSGNVNIDGTENVTLTATIAGDSIVLGTDTTGDYVAAVAVSGAGLSVSGSGEAATYTITSNATNNNTASTIVARDASGNFVAGTITATLTGNASTATALQTARNINGVSFNGTGDITVTAAAGTLSGNTLASGVTTSSLTQIGTLTNGAVPASLVTAGTFGAGAYGFTGNVTITSGNLIMTSGGGRFISISTTLQSQWDTSAGRGVLLGAYASLGYSETTGAAVVLSNAAISNSPLEASTGYKFLDTGPASRVRTAFGAISLDTSVSGVAGGAITWKPALTIAADTMNATFGSSLAITGAFTGATTGVFSGNVGIGVTPSARNNTRLQIVDGIGFPATQVASSDANTLDDYEEGTWTPVATRDVTAPSLTYTVQAGTYTKIGRYVIANCAIVINSISSAGSGNTIITGLPFGNAETTYSGLGIVGYNDALVNTVYSAWISSTTIFFKSGTRSQSNDTGGWSAGGYLNLTMTYQVAT
jgi:hypothetical protein